MTREVVLIDLSSIAYPIWHMSQSEPDANRTSQQTVARVRALATGHPHAAICCDAGRSFRRDLAPSYKAARPEHDASLQHQIDLAKEQLAADGFPVWAVKGFEADDLIATATKLALDTPDLIVLVVSADKDLLQLVGPRVRAMSVRDGSILDAAAVMAKFGVGPHQMRDYLTLVGDASDNIKGVKGIGPKRAAELLAAFGSLDELYRRLTETGGAGLGLTPSGVAALKDFRSQLPTTRTLITLRSDVDLPFAEIARERVPKEVESFGAFGEEDKMETQEIPQPTAELASQDNTTAPSVDAAQGGVIDPPGNTVSAAATVSASRLNQPTTTMAVRDPDVLALPPAEWERQLDPRSMKDAITLAKNMYDSRMFSAYGTPQAVLATVMVGRELGLPAMASLRSIHNIEGRHCLAAALMVALILKSGLAEYFDPVSFDDQQATYETRRKGARKSITLTHTIKMAETAGLMKKDSNWVKVPTDMLVARAQSRLARMVYPDLLAGLYTPDELSEIREQAVA